MYSFFFTFYFIQLLAVGVAKHLNTKNLNSKLKNRGSDLINFDHVNIIFNIIFSIYPTKNLFGFTNNVLSNLSDNPKPQGLRIL